MEYSKGLIESKILHALTTAVPSFEVTMASRNITKTGYARIWAYLLPLEFGKHLNVKNSFDIQMLATMS